MIDLLAALCLLAALQAPAATAATPAPSSLADMRDGELTVFAAASLADVLEDLERAWLARYPRVPLVVSLDASNVLATQIAEGAAADVFLSADRARPDELASAGLASGAPLIFAGNGLTIVTPIDSPLVREPADLARPGVRIVAAGPGVPITRYAEAALAQLAATLPDPAAFEAAVAANVVSREGNVRAALAKVELGEADAAIVYRTDAGASELVREVPLPSAVAVTADYAALQISPDPAAAAFVAWLVEPEAIAVLAAAGFVRAAAAGAALPSAALRGAARRGAAGPDGAEPSLGPP